MRPDSKYIDLHCHLDGAITVEIAGKLAEDQNIILPAETDEELKTLLSVPPGCRDLNEFLKCFELPCRLMQTPEGIENAAYYVAEKMYSEGVIYAELRFAPQLHQTAGMDQEEAVQRVLAGLRRSRLKSNLILCCMRGEGNEEENRRTVELAGKYLAEDGGVAAVDLAGAEAVYKTENYASLFAVAAEAGIPFTIHAGEADVPDSIRRAIEFGAVRIGHGIAAYKDEELRHLIREKGITLEMCPTSNRITHAIEDFSAYPLIDFLNEGIRVTINTDDPAIEGTDIAEEFGLMEREFGLTREQRIKVLENSIDAAFTTASVKEELKKQITAGERIWQEDQ